MKIHTNINNAISALNLHESPKFRIFQEIAAEEHGGDVRF